MSSKSRVVAIDGPSGSGKSTVAKLLSQSLGVIYIDTGAMYRALAYSCDQNGIPFEEGPQLKHFLKNLDLEYGKSDESLIVVNSENLTQKIREHHVSKLASVVSQIPSVRQFLLNFQRQLARENVCVMEGRDIGTIVFPEAFCKFFITASKEVRAQRRLDQLRKAGDGEVTLEQVVKDVEKRDLSDSSRSVAPLRQAEDALFLDTSDLAIEEIIEQLAEVVRKKAQEVGIEL